MRLQYPTCLALALAAALAFASPAWAEPEGGPSIEDQIKEQMDKIIRLMEENEAAILEASTGGKADPKRVDVPVPPGKESSGQGGAGQSSAKKLEELINSQRSTGKQIPGELEELVRLVPQ